MSRDTYFLEKLYSLHTDEDIRENYMSEPPKEEMKSIDFSTILMNIYKKPIQTLTPTPVSMMVRSSEGTTICNSGPITRSYSRIMRSKTKQNEHSHFYCLENFTLLTTTTNDPYTFKQ